MIQPILINLTDDTALDLSRVDGVVLDLKRVGVLFFGQRAETEDVSEAVRVFVDDPTFPPPCKVLRNSDGKVTKRYWFYVHVMQWMLVHKEQNEQPSRATEEANDIWKQVGNVQG